MTEMRQRKAWRVWFTWQDSWTRQDVIYAPTGDKAKAELVRRARDTDYSTNHWGCVRARRWPEKDVFLPDLHPVAERLTPKQRHIVLHAFGGDRMRTGFREHFVTHPGHLDLLKLAWEEGLFSGPHNHPGDGRRSLDGTPDSSCFLLTRLGKEVALSMVATYPRHG